MEGLLQQGECWHTLRLCFLAYSQNLLQASGWLIWGSVKPKKSASSCT